MTTLQTLADFADLLAFIRDIPTEIPEIILYGSGDGATYATWLKQLYPDLITGVIAYGPKLNAVLDFADFYPDVVNTVVEVNEDCADIIAHAFDEIGLLLDAGQATIVQSILNFNPNADLNNSLDVFSMYFFIAGTLSTDFISSKYDHLSRIKLFHFFIFFSYFSAHKASTKLVQC